MWTQGELDAVDQAIASGTAEVKYADRTIRYRSVADLLKAREVIQQGLASQQGTITKRHLRVWTENGF